MTGGAHSDDPDFIEALFRAAERKAVTGMGRVEGPSGEMPAGQAIPDKTLKAVAARELRQIGLRQQFFPSRSASSIDWIILLEIYTNEGGAGAAIALARIADHCGVSKATAARYIAGLIESSLVVRSSTNEGRDIIGLHLTSQGRVSLTKVLSHYLEELC